MGNILNTSTLENLLRLIVKGSDVYKELSGKEALRWRTSSRIDLR
jgi:hypothetical protein